MTTNPPAFSPRSRVFTRFVVVVALALAACGSRSDSGGASATSATTAPTSASSPAASQVTVSDAWVKTTQSGMTAAFGTLTNLTHHKVSVTGASAPASGMVELHEVVTVNGVPQMRLKQSGFVIAAHGTHTLAPGGDHIMLMNITQPITAGDTVTITLLLSDGTSASFDAVAKDFSGANETYHPGTSMPGMTSSPTGSTAGGTMTP